VASGRIITKDDEIAEILKATKTIAVLGLSPKPERDSHKVANYLKANGYCIIPVRPGQKEILGEKAYASLDEIDEPVDMIDVFRSPDQVMAHAREALRVKPKVFWMQLGIEHPEAARLLAENGIDVVMNRCTKVDHERYVKKIRLL
jgi:predicted CoA-binding protein